MSDLPKQTVCQAFVLRRVPKTIAIEYGMLLSNINQDIEDSEEQHGFQFSQFSRRATPEWILKFLLQRKLLSRRKTDEGVMISRNERTERYVARLPERVVALIDKLPVCDPLILLAGITEDSDE